MATIKALEGRTVHQIQSGQVIVDLCSVVKELVENSLDAGATTIDVRFKANGLESIEVQDNGVGISKDNYETVALKHYTSKLSNYDDLMTLQTFGFRGEALSSLCALSNFHIVTARAEEAPKGSRLDFEQSGRLKATSIVASQKGTTIVVENLFAALPVRRRELEKNIKREYGKVLTILQSYACISTHVKLSVSNIMPKGKKASVFATKANGSTRENIANVYGAKVLPGLAVMDLCFEMQESHKPPIQGWTARPEAEDNRVRIVGHVSRPVFGEGRQTPDRQMFFVNARPCGLPQVAKLFNEVYKSFNVSQSPFVFANIILDTNAYDVNVSPNKRTILLHDQGVLLENLRKSLIELFEKQDQTVPQTLPSLQKLPSINRLSVRRETSTTESISDKGEHEEASENLQQDAVESSGVAETSAATIDGLSRSSLVEGFAARDTRESVHERPAPIRKGDGNGAQSRKTPPFVNVPEMKATWNGQSDEYEGIRDIAHEPTTLKGKDVHVLDFNKRLAEQQAMIRDEPILQHSAISEAEEGIPIASNAPAKPSLGVVQTAFDRMRPRRNPVETAEVTIGDKTTTTVIGTTVPRKPRLGESPIASRPPRKPASQMFTSSMRTFAAPGTQFEDDANEDFEDEEQISEEESLSDHPSSPVAQEKMGLMTKRPNASNPSQVENDSESNLPESAGDDQESDEEYLDEKGKKAREDARVAALIQQAEEAAATPSENNIKRAHDILKGGGQKDSTTQLVQLVEGSITRIYERLQSLESSLKSPQGGDQQLPLSAQLDEPSPEECLSLIVSKEDFARMHVVGQFNLGFILALRPARSSGTSDELFIIDQHASDEKSNFERLQSTTIVQNQRLVHPYQLDLTAIEEEIILEQNAALLKNGFLIDVDTSGYSPVGQRCKLVSLPMSREVTFDTSDLEELIALLADTPASATNVPRPSKVRKMFAMRACRSSIMIGKSLSPKQMKGVVRRMGEIDKPWNCPHGRPTMRHVLRLAEWEGWTEGSGLVGMTGNDGQQAIDWRSWLQAVRRAGEDQIQADGSEDEMGEEEALMSVGSYNDQEDDNDSAEEDDHEVPSRLDLQKRFAHDG